MAEKALPQYYLNTHTGIVQAENGAEVAHLGGQQFVLAKTLVQASGPLSTTILSQELNIETSGVPVVVQRTRTELGEPGRTDGHITSLKKGLILPSVSGYIARNFTSLDTPLAYNATPLIEERIDLAQRPSRNPSLLHAFSTARNGVLTHKDIDGILFPGEDARYISASTRAVAITRFREYLIDQGYTDVEVVSAKGGYRIVKK